MQITKYKCDICGTIFDTEEECKKCQSSHYTQLYIKSISFSPKSILHNAPNEFPYKIVVSDVNQNITKEYYLK